MINATGAIDAGLLKLVDFTLSNPLYKWFVIPLLIAAFAFAGGSFGLSEEVLVFVLITIPLAISLGVVYLCHPWSKPLPMAQRR